MIQELAQYRTAALLGSYAGECAPALRAGVYEAMGHIAAGGDPEHYTAQVQQHTASSNVPFSRWEPTPVAEEAVQRRVDLQIAYGTISPSELQGRQDSDDAFRGGGSITYLVNKETAQPVVIKDAPAADLADRVKSVETRLNTLLPGQGIAGFEQAFCVRYDTGTTGSEFLPGKSLALLTPDDLRAIQPEHLGRLAQTVRKVSERGIFLDFFGVGCNINFHAEPGFGIYDALGTGAPDEAWVLNAQALLVTVRGLGGLIREGLPRLVQPELEQLQARFVSDVVAAEPQLANFLH